MSDYIAELNTSKRAAKSAAKIIQKYQTESSFKVDYKGKNDLVTEADLRAEKEILSIIREEFPDDNILAEESSTDKSMPKGRTWLVDPIDGTTNFTHGFPIYCVSIGLWENQEPKMGLVLEVNSNERFTALKGKGAFLNGDPITVSKVKDYKEAVIGTGFPYNDFSLIDSYLEFLKMLTTSVQGLRRPGAASYDLCCVACGRFDGFYEYSLNPWDVGAAALIVKEAGGKISDWEGKGNWLFGKRMAAGNPDIHKYLLHEIEKYFDVDEISAD